MRLQSCFVLCLSLLSFSALAWTAEDHEIFDLNSALEAAEGKETSFYSFLNVTSSTTTSELSKAYRKRSLELHPDKNPNVKGIHEKFAMLGTINAILKDKEKRKRYDHFHRNGFPRWKGTGYYYSRFRPGLGSVMTFLTLLSLGIQYMVQHINYRADLARVNRFADLAREQAFGNKPDKFRIGRKKVRVPITARGEGGPQLNCMVEGKAGNGPDNVWIIEDDGSESPLDATAVEHTPAFSKTWLPALIRSKLAKAPGVVPSEILAENKSGSGTNTPTSEGLKKRKGKGKN